MEEALVIDQVLEGLPDFVQVDIVVILHLPLNLICFLHYVLSEELETLDFAPACGSGPLRARRFVRVLVVICLPRL